MPDQPKQIIVQPFPIVSVQLKPVADVLSIIPSRSATIQYVIGKLIPGKPEIPGVPAIPGKVGRGQILESGNPGDPDYQPYVPAIDGYPETPAVPPVPAVPDQIIPIESGTVEMTDVEWSAWDSKVDDGKYRATIVAKALSLTLKP